MPNEIRTIDRVHRPDPQDFHREYIAKNRPVIITGIVDQWRAASHWTPDYFKSAFPNVTIRYETWEGDEGVNDPVEFFTKKQEYSEAPMAAFIDKIQAAKEPTRKFYCAGFRIFDAIPQLKDDIQTLDSYMCWPRFYPRWLKEFLKQPAYLWLGPSGALSTLHFDRTHNFFVQFYGRKMWTMIAPDQSRYVYFPYAEMGSSVFHFSPVDVEHPDLARFPLFAKAQLTRFVIEPGEILFTPAGWWHHVRALNASVSLNFFWSQPLANVFALRNYSYLLARRVILSQLGLKKLVSRLEARNLY